jgi:hypothetical protein
MVPAGDAVFSWLARRPRPAFGEGHDRPRLAVVAGVLEARPAGSSQGLDAGVDASESPWNRAFPAPERGREDRELAVGSPGDLKRPDKEGGASGTGADPDVHELLV